MACEATDAARLAIDGQTVAMATVALVLGAGGAVGHAFHVGVLSALADEFGWDARSADLIVGTSAGAVVGATVRAGLDPLDMRRRALRQPLSPAGGLLARRSEAAMAAAQADLAGSADGTDMGATLRRLRIASPERVLRAMREPWKVTPGSLFSALVPPGRVPTDFLGAAYDDLLGDEWPGRDLWIAAVNLHVGHRVVFGRAGSPRASLGEAVEASCAIPGYFAPVTIEGARYVDGGVHSTTNADLVAGFEPLPALAVVCAPMSGVGAALELPRFSLRQLARRSVAREARLLRDRRVEVVTLQPTAADLEHMSGNTMDPTKAEAVCRQVVQSTLDHVRTPDIADRLTALRT